MPLSLQTGQLKKPPHLRTNTDKKLLELVVMMKSEIGICSRTHEIPPSLLKHHIRITILQVSLYQMTASWPGRHMPLILPGDSVRWHRYPI